MEHFVRKGIRILCITYYILYSFSVTLKKALASCVFSTLNSVEISCYLEFFSSQVFYVICRSGSVCLDVINQTWSPMFGNIKILF